MKNRLFLCFFAMIGVGAMITGLCADESTPALPVNLQDRATQTWLLEQTASIAKDPETSAVWAVDQAADMLKGQPAQTAVDYFQGMLYQVKNHSVQRAIRFQLVSLYRSMDRQDKATEQLNELMSEPE